MSNLTIPGALYTPVMQLVNDHGYSVEDAIAKAAADAVRTRQDRPHAPEGAQPDHDTGAGDTTPQKRNTGALRIRVNNWTPPTVKQGGGVNAHVHWRNKRPQEKNAHKTGRKAAIASGYTAADVPDMPVLVAVIHWEKRSRRKDADNALNSVKHLCDGICKGLGIDDKRFVTSMAFQRIDPKRIGFVDIIIRPATAAERKLAS